MARVKYAFRMHKPKVYSANNFRCQKCLEKGHFTFECTGKRKYVSRLTFLQKKARIEEREEVAESVNVVEKKETPPVMKDKDGRKKSSLSSGHSDDSTSEDSESDSTSSSSSESSSSSSSSSSSTSSSSSSSSSTSTSADSSSDNEDSS